MKPVYRIHEYGSFITGKNMDGYTTLPPETFRQLENFILSQHSRNADALELMGLSARKGVGRVITARNYVGVLVMQDGTILEILPKVHSALEDDETGSRTKQLLINMLRTLRESPFRNLQTASVDVKKLNIFEVFIRMFVDEMFLIVKRGLQCQYETTEENVPFFKGKMVFAQQLRQNLVHQERNYVAYDAFTMDRPENRLLKSTLLFLYRHSVSPRNRNDLKLLLNAFAEVRPSEHVASDFTRCIPDRQMTDYAIALQWARVFLMGQSFSAFAGTEVALALLFPMETLFERYIAALLRRKLLPLGFTVAIQDKTWHLFNEPGRQFQLCPDIVLTRKADGTVFIIDTKWKLLQSGKVHDGIAPSDMYQMYAYQKKYAAHSVTLIYPQTDLFRVDNQITFRAEDGACVHIRFVDLFDVHRSLNELLQHTL